MDKLLRVSIIVPTRNRPNDLGELLQTTLNQNYPSLEVIIIDDSHIESAKQIFDSYSPKFESANYKLKYVRGSGDGLPSARNLGVELSEGDAILFVDDDTLLDRNVIGALVTFLQDNPVAVGIQPKIVPSTGSRDDYRLAKKFENIIYKVLMLTYSEENKQTVRRSGMDVFPSEVTKVIPAQRLSGCCSCYRREVVTVLSFDTNLKRWAFMEDLDFSYRVYKKNPGFLYVIPHANIVHKASGDARLSTKLSIYMRTIYWFYVFFKDVFEGSILNLTAFLCALTGSLLTTVGGLITKRKPKREWWGLIYLLGSYATAFRNLKNIRMLRLEFFNKNLNK
jgi:GT2 family glycosyltransferase